MAEYIEIAGGFPLRGSVRVSGAKNAALPLLIASLLTSEKCEFSNLPNLLDVNILTRLLEHFGGQVSHQGSEASIQIPKLIATEARYSLVKALRASFWILAPLLARGRAARVALPGGDIIGARPVDMHLEAFAKMGADVVVKHGVVYATATQGLRPATIDLRFPSVGATHQILMAASLINGTSVINGAAREPEVVALAEMLSQMGAKIEGAGSSTIRISGCSELGGARVKVIGDRIEAGTYMLAAAVTKGDIQIDGITAGQLGQFKDDLQISGLSIEESNEGLHVKATEPLKALKIRTSPFPGFATDMQAPIMAALCTAEGESTIEENVFEGRFGHVAELCRMGASIKVEERIAHISGVEALNGAPVEGLDIRGAAALVVAALGADGLTQVYEPHHLYRGYEALEQKLSSLGAHICCKVADPEDFMFTGC